MIPTTVATEQETIEGETYVAQGRHLVLTLNGCPAHLLNDETFLRQLSIRAVEATGAEMLQIMSHHFEPQGVTVLVLLAESHASLHTYPEVGTLFWDCFTCGTRCVPEQSIAVLEAALQPASVRWDCFTRGEDEHDG